MTKSTEKEQVMPHGADTGPGLRGCWVWLPPTEVSMGKAEEIAYYPKLYFPPHLQRWEILQASLKIKSPAFTRLAEAPETLSLQFFAWK